MTLPPICGLSNVPVAFRHAGTSRISECLLIPNFHVASTKVCFCLYSHLDIVYLTMPSVPQKSGLNSEERLLPFGPESFVYPFAI